MYNNTYNQLTMLPYITWSYSYIQPANGHVAVWEGLTVNGSPMVDAYGNAICVDYYGNPLPYNMPGCRPSGVWKIYNFSELYAILGDAIGIYARYNAFGACIFVFSTYNFISNQFCDAINTNTSSSSTTDSITMLDNLSTYNAEQVTYTLKCRDTNDSFIKHSICNPISPESGVSIKDAYVSGNYNTIRLWAKSGNAYKWFDIAKRIAKSDPKCFPDINYICSILVELQMKNVIKFGVSPNLRSFVAIPSNTMMGGDYNA